MCKMENKRFPLVHALDIASEEKKEAFAKIDRGAKMSPYIQSPWKVTL